MIINYPFEHSPLRHRVAQARASFLCYPTLHKQMERQTRTKTRPIKEQQQQLLLVLYSLHSSLVATLFQQIHKHTQSNPYLRLTTYTDCGSVEEFRFQNAQIVIHTQWQALPQTLQRQINLYFMTVFQQKRSPFSPVWNWVRVPGVGLGPLSLTAQEILFYSGGIMAVMVQIPYAHP